MEYLNYNQPIPGIFDFTPPLGAIIADQSGSDIGLPIGELTEHEIAAEVVKQFALALHRRDYEKAGRIYGGLSSSTMQKMFGIYDVTDTIAINEITPATNSQVHAYHVYFNGSYKMPAGITAWNSCALVSQVHGQTDRWVITGGILPLPTGMPMGDLPPEQAAHNIVEIMLKEYLATNTLALLRYVIKDPTGKIIDRNAYTAGGRIIDVKSISDGTPTIHEGILFYDVTVEYKQQVDDTISETNQIFNVTTIQGYPDRLIIYQ